MSKGLPKKILGISAFYHDSAATITIGGNIVAAAQEERFSRIKNTAAFPVNAIRFCLDQSKLKINDLDAVIFYDKPLLKFERLLQTYYSFAPKGLFSFLKAMPVWLKDKVFLKRLILKGLKEVETCETSNFKLLFSEHHLSHAASTFYPSPFSSAAILTIDGVGEWCTTSISKGDGAKIVRLKEMEFPNSIGLLYSAFTYYLGFEVNSGEYKVMGLAPYGDPLLDETQNYIQLIKTKLLDIKSDGSVWLNQRFFSYCIGTRMTKDREWENLFRLKRRKPEAPIEQQHCNFAYAIQDVLQEIILKLAAEAKNITGSDNLCLAGGVALNSVANGCLSRKGIFKSIFIQPASGDAGGALGAALAANYIYFNDVRKIDPLKDQLSGSYLGPAFTNEDIERLNTETKAVFKKYGDYASLTNYVSGELADGKVIGWFQGRMEFGPRALGNRSILADARDTSMQERLNLKVKFRESFRPFAPAVLEERMSDYFDLKDSSPFMLIVGYIKCERRNYLPSGYNNWGITERLNCKRSDIPAVTHLDFSARVQTVKKDTNNKFWELIKAFEVKTGCAVILNTSFNVKDEPIVCSPSDAYRCFMKTGLDILVINDYVYQKTEQPGLKINKH